MAPGNGKGQKAVREKLLVVLTECNRVWSISSFFCALKHYIKHICALHAGNTFPSSSKVTWPWMIDNHFNINTFRLRACFFNYMAPHSSHITGCVRSQINTTASLGCTCYQSIISLIYLSQQTPALHCPSAIESSLYIHTLCMCQKGYKILLIHSHTPSFSFRLSGQFGFAWWSFYLYTVCL